MRIELYNTCGARLLLHTAWAQNETEDDGIDEKMKVDQVLVDYIIGDLEFHDQLLT